MIVIDRQNSNGLWAFKLVDGNEIKIIQEVKTKKKGEANHIYLIKDTLRGDFYLFGGDINESYKNYIGFNTTMEEVERYKNDISKIYNMDFEFNSKWKDN